jgi:hypothetical protein
LALALLLKEYSCNIENKLFTDKHFY